MYKQDLALNNKESWYAVKHNQYSYLDTVGENGLEDEYSNPEDSCISNRANTLRYGMTPIILPPAMVSCSTLV